MDRFEHPQIKSTWQRCKACGDAIPEDVGFSILGPEDNDARVCKPCARTRWWEQPGEFKPAFMRSIRERLDAKTRVLEEPCHIWEGADSGNGYGRISIDGKNRGTHIVTYELEKGPVPAGTVLDHHLCHNRLCRNVNHLDPNTPLENTLVGRGPTAKNARKTHCKKGHEFTEGNTILRERNGRTHRECRLCKKLRGRKRNEEAVQSSSSDIPNPQS